MKCGEANVEYVYLFILFLLEDIYEENILAER